MKKKNTNTDLKKKRIIFGIILGVLIIAAITFVIVKYNLLAPKSEYSSNVTDVIKIKGQIVSYKYNNYQFEKRDNMWFTEIMMGNQPYIIAFTYGPINIENLTIGYKDNYFQELTKPGSKVYVTFDHNSTNASYIATSAINLITNLKTVYGVNVSRACLYNSSVCSGAPIVTCEDHPDNAVIQFIDAPYTYALYDSNCLTIWGSKDDFIKETEKIILDWYGIV